MVLSYPDPELRSPLVHLRAWTMDDLACVREASSDPEIPKGTTVPAEYSDAEGRAWIERQWSRQTSGQGLSLAVVEEASGRAVGLVYLGLRTPDGHCELGYWLVPGARGRGLGSDAVKLASEWVLANSDVYRLFALVVPGNDPSFAVLDRSGFQREGLLRSFIRRPDGDLDVVSLSLLASDIGAEPTA